MSVCKEVQTMSKYYKAMYIANYIIWFAQRKFELGITNLQLQKILYFAYVQYLLTFDKKLFGEAIEKWQYGPVIPEVYHAFKDYGFYKINEPKQQFDVEFINGKLQLNEQPFDPSLLEHDDQTLTLINKVIHRWIKIPAFELVEITHAEPMWKNYQNQIINGEKSLIYTDQEIKQFHKSQQISP